MSARTHRQRGAALLAAMLTVTLVASFAAAALWQQWRAVEVESAERARLQSAWVLVGALDWSRLILREDARTAGPNGGVDSLSEPWAVPLAEARLSSFLAADKNIASDALEGLPDAFLSGRILDAQAKLNVRNLVNNGQPDTTSQAAFAKLFQLLGLPGGELSAMVANLRRATAGTTTVSATDGSTTSGSSGSSTTTTATTTSTTTTTTTVSTGGDAGDAPLLPQQATQLGWLGLSAPTLAALQPYVTILPVRTPLNLNTATAEAIFASNPTLDLASAKRVVAARAGSHFTSVAAANNLLPANVKQFDAAQFSVSTGFFEVYGRLRLDRTWVEERSLLQRDNPEVKVVWRERGAGTTLEAVKP